MMSVSKTYTPITIANYMDDMRDDKRSEFLKAWHFTNVPFFDGIPESDIELPRVNIETQLEESIEILRANAFSTDPKKRFKEAINLAYLFHLIGDLHQPLHCVSRYSTEHPRGLGDIGGNSFFLDRVPPGQKNKEKLHGYWDAGGRQFTFVSRPLSSEGFNTIRNFAFQSMREYPDRNPDWKETAVSVWINESRELAVANAYKDTANRPLKQFVEPDDDYRNRAQKIARRRVAMAGYRLAALLNSIYPNR